MLTLGINYGGIHDASAAINLNGKLAFAVAEERISRIKHDGGFPAGAIRASLAHVGASERDIDRVVFGWPSPYRLLSTDTGNRLRGLQPIGLLQFCKSTLLGLIDTRRNDGARLMSRHFPGCSRPVERIDHHYAHAISSFAVSGFEEATVVVIDGRGAWESTTVWYGRDDSLDLIDLVRWPNSIGLFYAEFTAYLGFERYQDEWKVMGLAPYGEAGVDLAKFIRVRDTGYEVNGTALLGQTSGPDFSEIRQVCGPARKPDEAIEDRHRAIAWAVQDACERAEIAVIRNAVLKTRCRNLCLAGGVALNSKANGLIVQSGLVDRVFVQPAASDDGVAVGAALAPAQNDRKLQRVAKMDAYLGPESDPEAIEKALRIWKVPYQTLDDPSDIAAAMISEGKLIGWFQGREEFGPRALGNRSILADPRDVRNRDRVNTAVKFRESWRPFAPSILHEFGDQYLENYQASPFMTLTFRVRPERREAIAAAVHVDGSARVQSVTREQNARYYDLIRRFADRTGVPAVLNTSFNLKGEAIVSTPSDAVRTFYTSGLDALILDRFLVVKDVR